ncbi:hypothetical protein FRC06_004993 [Ceratobasidium sp. 370]|nr:hypothetical protein FRC06_004993 [Ceratobasidium sp. 370]
MLALNTLAIGAASLFAVVAADHGHLLPRSRHHNVAERSEHHLQKRFGGRATYYQTGMGACGKYNNPSDKIVALNAPQFGGGYPGPNCFKMITICKGDNCHPAQIMDMCPGCDYGALDMSQSLFEQFANTDDGVFQMTWCTYDLLMSCTSLFILGVAFNDDKPEEPKTTEKPDPPKTSKKPDPPKTTKEPEPEPTTTWEPPTTTSKKHTSTSTHETTSTPEPTTSTSTSTSSKPTTTSTSEARSSAASTSELPTTTANTSAAPSTTTEAGSGSGSGSTSGSNWADLNQVMLAMGRLATVAHGAE